MEKSLNELTDANTNIYQKNYLNGIEYNCGHGRIVRLEDLIMPKILQILRLIDNYVETELVGSEQSIYESEEYKQELETQTAEYEQGITADEMLFIKEVVQAKLGFEPQIITFEVSDVEEDNNFIKF